MNNINWKLKKYQLKAANTSDILKKQVYLLKINQYINLANKTQYGGALPAALQKIADDTKGALRQVIEGFSKDSVEKAVSEISTKVDEFKGSYRDLANEFTEVSKLASQKRSIPDYPGEEKDKIIANLNAEEIVNIMIAESLKASVDGAGDDATELAKVKSEIDLVSPEIKAELRKLLGEGYAHLAELGF